MTAKQLTRIGLFHIEEAILDTLFQAGDEYVHAADIARTLGLKSWDESDWIVAVLLYKLDEDRRVEARRDMRGRRTGWKLTTRERNRRADISDT